MIVSKRHIQNIIQFKEEEKKTFASILKMLTCKYDNLFTTTFLYSAGLYQMLERMKNGIDSCIFTHHFYEVQ